MTSKQDISNNKELIQGVLIAENFNDNFAPLTDDAPFCLLPIVNMPMIELSLDYLSLGGVQELFVFCCSHVQQTKRYIMQRIKERAIWSITMKVHIVVSETCHSLGDCMRDLDAKGLIRGTFILAEAGVIGKEKYRDVIKKHNNILAKKDKGLAMTMINIDVGGKRPDECPYERQIVLVDQNDRILYHKRRSNKIEKKHALPMEIFLEHPSVHIKNDLMDTRVMICSPSVLPLFSDNFDFQTKDDFIRGILMNEEILGSTIYSHTIKVGYASAVTSWRRYQKISREVMMGAANILLPPLKQIRFGRDVIIGDNCTISDNIKLDKVVVGDNVKIGDNVELFNCYIFNNCTVEDNCKISYSVIGDNSVIGKGSRLSNSCVIGRNVILKENTSLENVTLKATPPELFRPEDKLGENAYIVPIEDEKDDDTQDDEIKNSIQYSRLYYGNDNVPQISWESDDSDAESELSHTRSPPPDDTKLFFTEVIDSLARGFEDKLQCDNLILEINSSRYAYNVTLKEVNYNVSKAILSLPFQHGAGQQYWHSLQSSLVYFSPILKNYIRSEDAMEDCLQAMEDVATSNTELADCIVKVLNWFYDEDHISEELILKWSYNLDKSQRLYERVQPFIKWLQEAEEASSSDE